MIPLLSLEAVIPDASPPSTHTHAHTHTHHIVAPKVAPPIARVAVPSEPSDLFVFGSNPFGALGLGEDETIKFRPAAVPFEEGCHFKQVRA